MLPVSSFQEGGFMPFNPNLSIMGLKWLNILYEAILTYFSANIQVFSCLNLNFQGIVFKMALVLYILCA